VNDYPEEIAATAEADDPLHILTARESWSEVATALNRLTEEQRMVVLYRCVLGYSTEEVGQLLGKPAGTIRALQFRALAQLSRLLGVEQIGTPSKVRRGGQRYGTRR
jgi:RNA polymerase sigma factor (sigma-70 family)